MTTTPADPGTTEQAPSRARTRAVVLGALVLAIAIVGGGYAWLHGGTPKPPYTDPSATGRLTICDAHGKPVTSGSTEKPLGAVVVGDEAAPAAYAGNGRTAALMVYQPRAGVGPEEWTGLQLNAASGYPAGAHPSTNLDAGSTTLAQFVRGYPAADGGWLQLRLVLGAAGVAQGRAGYAAGDLHISGTTWTLTDPGTAGCS
jgi:hypothetical protein